MSDRRAAGPASGSGSSPPARRSGWSAAPPVVTARGSGARWGRGRRCGFPRARFRPGRSARPRYRSDHCRYGRPLVCFRLPHSTYPSSPRCLAICRPLLIVFGYPLLGHANTHVHSLLKPPPPHRWTAANAGAAPPGPRTAPVHVVVSSLLRRTLRTPRCSPARAMRIRRTPSTISWESPRAPARGVHPERIRLRRPSLRHNHG